MIFSEQNINDYTQKSTSELLSRSIGQELDDKEALILEEEALEGTPFSTKESNGYKQEFFDTNEDTAVSEDRVTMQPITTRVTGLAPESEDAYWGNKDYTRSVRQNYAREYNTLHNWDTMMMHLMGRPHEKVLVEPDKANNIAKEMGANLKFDKDITEHDLYLAINTNLRKKELEEKLAKASATGSLGWTRDAMVMSSALAGGMGKSELALSLSTAFLTPYLAVAGVAKGASVLDKMLKVKRVTDVIKAQNTLRGINFLSTVASTEGAVGNVAASLLRKSPEAIKAMKKIDFYKALRATKKINYESLTASEKTLLDGLTWVTLDAPIATSKRWYSTDVIQQELYTEKDKMTESMTALFLGAVFPGTLRGVGKALGINPVELKVRQIQEAKRAVTRQVATGWVDKEVGKTLHSTLTSIEKNLTKGSAFTYNPRLLKAVEQLQQANISNKTLINQLAYINECILNDIPIKLHDIPEYESLLSSVDASVLRRLFEGNPIEDVFGSNLVRHVTKHGLVRLAVNGEYGLLGTREITALTEEQGMRMMESLYRGVLHGASLADDMPNPDLEKFKIFAQRMKAFATNMKDITHRWRKKLDQMEGKGDKKEKLNYVDLRNEMRFAFRSAFLGSERAYELGQIKRLNKNTSHMGFEDIATPELDEIDALFDEWFSKIGRVETKVTKSGRSYEVVYLLDEAGENTGRSKGLANLNKYIADLDQGADDNLYLADLDNVLFGIEQSRLKDIRNAIEDMDVTSDPEILKVLGVERKNFTTLVGESRDKVTMDSILSQKRMEYNKIAQNSDYSEAIRILRNESNVNPEIGSVFNRAADVIENIQQVKKTGLGEFRRQVLTRLQNSEAFINKATGALKAVNAGKEVEWDVALEHILSDAIHASLEEFSIAKNLSKPMLARVVKSTVDMFKNAAVENPKILEALLDKETINRYMIESYAEAGADIFPQATKLKSTSARFEEGFTEELAKRNAENVINQNEIFKPLEDALDIALTHAELTAISEFTTATKLMNLMIANPANAAEVLTGAATQTMMQFQGAAMSVEAKSQIVGYYMRSMRKALRETDSTTAGRTLWEIFTEDENALNGVNEARIKMKHGEAYPENSDYARIAKIMDEHEATMLNEFKKHGLIYTDQAVPLDMSKFKYMDAAMSNSDIDALVLSVQRSLELDVDSVVDNLVVNEEGLVKSGNRWVEKNEALKNHIKRQLGEIQEELKDFFNIGNDVHRRTALYILRACDLDKMFGRYQIRKISLNEVRDAILDNRLDELIAGDAYRVKEIKAAVKEISSRIIGPVRKKKNGIAAGRTIDENGVVNVSASSKVYTLRTGMNNLAAVVTGSRSAAFDEFEGAMFFKNAEEELKATALFGYDTLEKQMKNVLTKQARALYSFENFGSDPLRMVTELVDTWNKATKNDGALREYLRDLAGNTRKNIAVDEAEIIADKYQIHESAKKSIQENVIFACGLQNSAPTAVTRVIRVFKALLSTPLLAAAGLKSLSDTGTMTAQLMLNAMVSSVGEGYKVQLEALNILLHNKDCLDLFLGASLIENEDFLKVMYNDPTMDLTKLSGTPSFLDKLEKGAHKYSDIFMNKLGLMSPITNSNKKVAALSIQLSMGKHADTAFTELPTALQECLLRDGIDEFEWDFIRTHMVRDLGEMADNLSGKRALVPQVIADSTVISDEVIHKALHEQGYLNITSETIQEFRSEMLSKTWVMVDKGADEMISVPSGRVMQWMRGGQPRNSVLGTFMEILTQFQSFGASLAYYNYGRYFNQIAGRETGISALDIFNPNVALRNASRSKVMVDTVGLMGTIAINMLIVDTAVNALRGNIQKPWDGEKVHASNYVSSALGALGVMGTVIDTIWEGVDGAGQRGGGFAIHAAPSVANSLRVLYRVGKPLTSSKVAMEDKAGAVGAAALQEVARLSGARTLPGVAMAWQGLLGAWLDMKAYGGRENYENYIKGKERRGQVIMPWEENPTFFGMP